MKECKGGFHVRYGGLPARVCITVEEEGDGGSVILQILDGKKRRCPVVPVSHLFFEKKRKRSSWKVNVLRVSHDGIFFSVPGGNAESRAPMLFWVRNSMDGGLIVVHFLRSVLAQEMDKKVSPGSRLPKYRKPKERVPTLISASETLADILAKYERPYSLMWTRMESNVRCDPPSFESVVSGVFFCDLVGGSQPVCGQLKQGPLCVDAQYKLPALSTPQYSDPPPDINTARDLIPMMWTTYHNRQVRGSLNAHKCSCSCCFQHRAQLRHKNSMAGIQVDGPWFVDKDNRVVYMRGINLSGNAKMPSSPKISTFVKEGFLNDTEISFVGRPFPLEEADSHFRRLKAWGFNTIRFCFTWEAIEHAGPGNMDKEYIDYVVHVLKIAGKYEFHVFMDPHQDMWSRYSGGSGAPGWTFKTVGLEKKNFKDTKAAIVQNTFDEMQEYPRMVWSTNAFKFAPMTMFTLFFGGRIFAPNLMIEGENVQDYLQSHFIQSVVALAQAIDDAGLHGTVVCGYDTLNEPLAGYIGLKDLSRLASEQEDLHCGDTPTPFEGMQLAAGKSVLVKKWDYNIGSVFGNVFLGHTLCNPRHISAWSPSSGGCVWAKHGVWDPQSGSLLKPGYFARHPRTGDGIEFAVDCWKPHVNAYGKALRQVNSKIILFVNYLTYDRMPALTDVDVKPPIAFSTHWYDGLTLLRKHFGMWNVNVLGVLRNEYMFRAMALCVGYTNIKSMFARQIKTLIEDTGHKYPVLIGEVGIPFDMDGRKAYTKGDYTMQCRAADASMTALECNLVGFTWWNYTADNTHLQGDCWNGEDLSIFSQDDADPLAGPFSGGRALQAIVRPFPLATAGTPLHHQFDYKTSMFKFEFMTSIHEERGEASLFFLPFLHYPSIDNMIVDLTDGSYDVEEEEHGFILSYFHNCSFAKHIIRITPATYQSTSICAPCLNFCPDPPVRLS